MYHNHNVYVCVCDAHNFFHSYLLAVKKQVKQLILSPNCKIVIVPKDQHVVSLPVLLVIQHQISNGNYLLFKFTEFYLFLFYYLKV